MIKFKELLFNASAFTVGYFIPVIFSNKSFSIKSYLTIMVTAFAIIGLLNLIMELIVKIFKINKQNN